MKDAVHIIPFEAGHMDEVIALHKHCFTKANNVSMRLGDAFLRKTYKFFLDDPKAFGFIGMYNGKIVGFLMGRLDYYVDALNAYRKGTLLTSLLTHPLFLFDQETRTRISALAQRLLNPKKAAARKAEMATAPSHVEGGTATLASLAVDPAFTSLKVSDMLVEASLQYARQKNMAILRTGIARNNMASRFIFSKKGFSEDKVLSKGEGMLYFKKLN